MNVLASNHDDPSAESIHADLINHYPTMSLATVYKTINLLKREGELLELEFSDLGNRYDGNKLYLHPHLIFGSNSEFRALAEVYGSADSQQQFVDDFVVAWNSSRQSVSSAKVLQALIFSDVFMQQVICWRSVVSVIISYFTVRELS